MLGDEIRTDDAVAVEKHAVVAARGQQRAVAHLGSAEAAMLLPDMGERDADVRLPALDQFRSRRPRAVVRHHDLEAPIALRSQRAQHRVERIRALVGGDDNGNQIGHGACSSERNTACQANCPN